jgi:hypothetical protein
MPKPEPSAASSEQALDATEQQRQQDFTDDVRIFGAAFELACCLSLWQRN